jgi:hypothetical protein
MRLFLLPIALGVPFLVFGQETQPRSLFETVRPQASIVVRKHPSGSDVVLVTLLDT